MSDAKKTRQELISKYALKCLCSKISRAKNMGQRTSAEKVDDIPDIMMVGCARVLGEHG